MPIITVQMFEGRSVEQKSELVDALSREFSRICNTPLDGIHVLIDELKKENWGIGGSLCSSLYPDQKI